MKTSWFKKTLWVYAGWILAFQTVGRTASGWEGADLEIPWDRRIPLIEIWIWPYLGTYLLPLIFWATETDWDRYRDMVGSVVAANLAAFAVFLAFPVHVAQGIPDSSASGRVLAWCYWLDFRPPANKFPAMHVGNAWLFFYWSRGSAWVRRVGFCLAAALITFASLFVKQHGLADVLAGMIWALLFAGIPLRRPG
jgi:hypothetical protein